jgi:hypothetical protein
MDKYQLMGPTPGTKPAAPSKNAVARKVVGKGGTAGKSAPVAPPPDPLETLRGEYDKYMADIFGGLKTSLEGERTQYKTRSDELAARLAATYADASQTASTAGDRITQQMQDYAQRMGLQQAAPTAAADWIAQNERLKTLNETAKANSLATNDMIRSNYYDFLGDKISSAEGMGATARAGINDVIANAILARQQAAQAAAAAAAARRSSGRRGGGGGGSKSGGGTSATKITSANDILNALSQANPVVREALMAGDADVSRVISAGLNAPTTINAGPWSGGQTTPVYKSQTRKSDYYSNYLPSALQLYAAKAVAGGPKTSTTTTLPKVSGLLWG